MLAASLFSAACSSNEFSEAGLDEQREPIIGGTLDSEFDAVMALVELDEGLCSGTVVAVRGQSGYLLTAAHCVAAPGTDPANLFVVPGPDFETNLAQSVLFPVEEFEVHPSYDGSDTSPADIAMVRFSGAGSSTPTIPIMSEQDDDVDVGSEITIVGYGRTSRGNQVNTERYRLDRTVIATPNVAQFIHDESDGAGTCGGDSGGPALSGMRVAGVTSFGTAPCASELGGSIRVSAYESFIEGFIDGTPTTASCGTCLLLESLPAGSCGDESAACGVGTDCDDFLLCLDACGGTDEACAQACFADHEQGQGDYLDLLLCSCNQGCDTECADDSRCDIAACGFEFSDATCNSCNESQCCAETTACALDLDCVECVTSSDPPFSCAQNQLFQDFRNCTPARCETECQIPQCGFGAEGDCGTCLESDCCSEASACDDDPVCSFCLTMGADDACAENQPLLDFLGCLANCEGDPCELGVEPAGEGGSSGTGDAGQSAGGQAGQAGSDATAAGDSAGGTSSSEAGAAGARQSDAGQTAEGGAGAVEDEAGTAGTGGAGTGTEAESGNAGATSAGASSAGDEERNGAAGNESASDAGASGSDDEVSQGSAGCSCRAVGGAPARPSFALWLALGWVLLRRRRLKPTF